MSGDFNITLDGLDACLHSLDVAFDTAMQVAETSINEACLLTETDAKKNAPVGTPESTRKKGYHGGRLRSSIHTTKAARNGETVQGKVSTNVLYAYFVEAGTHKMAARPYMHPAFRKNISKFLSKMQSRMQAALN